MTESELKFKLGNLASQLTRLYGDHGSCILGYNLKLDGVKVVSQPAQGSSTCEFVYGILKELMLHNGIAKSRISIDYGRMD